MEKEKSEKTTKKPTGHKSKTAVSSRSKSAPKPKKAVSGQKFTEKEIEKIIPSLEEMLKAGVHFGHRTSKWNAKMEPYIFTARNNVHIIDLEKTAQKLAEALKFLRQVKEKNGTILFVGTKVAAKEITKQTAKDCRMPYVSERWLGGTLTNFKIISQRLEYFRGLEEKKKKGELKKYTKKEQHEFDVELQKLEGQFGGIKNLLKLPEVLLVVDSQKEKLAVKEARMKKIPIVGLCDTNADPTLIDYPVPVNDDAITSLKLILGTINKVLK